MSEEERLRLIAEIEKKIHEFVDSKEISNERKSEILRELLAVALEE
jgi:hypothetical protein